VAGAPTGAPRHPQPPHHYYTTYCNILTKWLPEANRPPVSRVGVALVLGMRVALLFAISWVMRRIKVGAFLNTVIQFVIVAFAIFMMIKGLNSLMKEDVPSASCGRSC